MAGNHKGIDRKRQKSLERRRERAQQEANDAEMV